MAAGSRVAGGVGTGGVVSGAGRVGGLVIVIISLKLMAEDNFRNPYDTLTFNTPF